MSIGNNSFAYLYESVDGLTHLLTRAFLARSPNRFAIVRVAVSQQRFFSPRPTCSLDPRPGFDVIILDTRHDRSVGRVFKGRHIA